MRAFWHQHIRTTEHDRECTGQDNLCTPPGLRSRYHDQASPVESIELALALVLLCKLQVHVLFHCQGCLCTLREKCYVFSYFSILSYGRNLWRTHHTFLHLPNLFLTSSLSRTTKVIRCCADDFVVSSFFFAWPPLCYLLPQSSCHFIANRIFWHNVLCVYAAIRVAGSVDTKPTLLW